SCTRTRRSAAPTSRPSAWPGSRPPATSPSCGRASPPRFPSEPAPAGQPDARPSRLHPTRSNPMNPSYVPQARRSHLAVAVALLLAVPALQAQEAATLDAVEVTAQRKVENIQDV